MIYEPIGDGVILKKIVNKITTGGIVLPEAVKEVIGKATVMAVGPGRVTDCGREPMDIEVGDTVLYCIPRATDVDEYVLIAQSDIYMKIRDGDMETYAEERIHTVSPTLN